MAPRYIIHMGPMKTASTYVQQCLTAAQADLLQQGICYPQELLSENNKFMHLPVFYAIMRKQAETLRPVFAKLNAAGHKTVLLSCEHLHFLPPDGFRKLREVTGASDFKVVYTARRWSDRIGSLWNHALFMGGTQSLPEFYLSLLAGEPLHYYPKWMKDAGAAADLDYSITWDMISEIFGRDALTVFPYSAIMDRGEDVFEAFCRDVLELRQAPVTKFAGQRRWASMSTATQEMVRVLSEIHLAATADENNTMPVQFQRRRKHLAVDRITGAIEAQTVKLRIDDHAPQFDAPFAAMGVYADRVVGSDLLFKRAAKSVAYVRPGYMLQDGVREDYRAIYSALTEKE